MTDIDRNKVVFVNLYSGKFVKERGFGYECFNFNPDNGKYYGYAPPKATLNLKRISKKENIRTDSKKREYIDNVLVIFTETEPSKGRVIIGWYQNACIYAKPIERETEERHVDGKYRQANDPPYAPYNLVCSLDCGCSPDIKKGKYPIPYATKVSGGYGRRSFIWYADTDKDKEIREGAVDYVKSVILNNATNDERKYAEGHETALSIITRKRSKEARDACLKHYGYSCQICGFDFEKRYGDIGTRVIEVHHIKPLSESEDCAVIDSIKDLLPVCSNCHSMLHKQKPPLPVEALQSRVKQP